MKKTPLKRKTPLRQRSPLKQGSALLRKTKLTYPARITLKRTKLKQVSAKRKVEGVEYKALSKEFLKNHPKCEGCLWEWYNNPMFHGPIKPSTEIQHKALRGKYYLRTDTWAAVCREHGERCTVDNPWAYESGLRLTREQIRHLP